MKKIELTEEAKVFLTKSDDERIEYILRDRWINYTLAQNIIDHMEQIKKYEKNKTRITSLLLVGSSNNGKTSLLEEFIKRNEYYDYYDKDRDSIEDNIESPTGIPALYVLSPSEPSESRLYSNILDSINGDYKDSNSVSKKQHLVEHYLNLLNIEILIIDEIHNLLSGSITRQKQVLNAVKNLTNRLKIPIVLSGTKDALRAISTDNQIISRFRPIYLNKWKMDKDYISLLATILTTLPLKKESNILTSTTANEILEISEGAIGDIVGLIKQASIYAIKHRSEKITINEIKECGYISMKNVNERKKLSNI